MRLFGFGRTSTIKVVSMWGEKILFRVESHFRGRRVCIQEKPFIMWKHFENPEKWFEYSLKSGLKMTGENIVLACLRSISTFAFVTRRPYCPGRPKNITLWVDPHKDVPRSSLGRKRKGKENINPRYLHILLLVRFSTDV